MNVDFVWAIELLKTKTKARNKSFFISTCFYEDIIFELEV